jgi:hypothetical protein
VPVFPFSLVFEHSAQSFYPKGEGWFVEVMGAWRYVPDVWRAANNHNRAGPAGPNSTGLESAADALRKAWDEREGGGDDGGAEGAGSAALGAALWRAIAGEVGEQDSGPMRCVM